MNFGNTKESIKMFYLFNMNKLCKKCGVAENVVLLVGFVIQIAINSGNVFIMLGI